MMLPSVTPRILVVEDETDVRELVAVHLKRANYSVTAVTSVEEARGALAASRDTPSGFDVCVLDWMLSGTSGVDFARELRRKHERGDVAILMLTAKSEPHDIVEGLEAGADDYLTKPFEPSVLVARVRALTRRLKPNSPTLASAGVDASSASAVAHGMTFGPVASVGTATTGASGGSVGVSAALSSSSTFSKTRVPFEVIRLGGLSLFPETYEVKCGNDPIALTVSEFKLLLALAKSQGRVLTRDSLISQVQGDGVSVVGRTVDTHVFGLRKKLGNCADVIETVRGVGYRVTPELEG